jgi:hypothetical protein
MTKTTTVIVETMPEHLRSSHRAAGNWGSYPVNGATRERLDLDEAEEIVEADEDGYDHIVEGTELTAGEKSDVSDWETVSSYVATFESGTDQPGACDVEVQIGCAGSVWYLRTHDDGGNDDCDATAYETEEAAREAAEEFADDQNEGEAGEDAEKYLARQLEEAAGEPCDDGEYCVYWASACKEDKGVSARYETIEQATAAAEIKNNGLHQHNPGQLLCGFEVRQLTSVDGHMQWVEIGE